MAKHISEHIFLYPFQWYNKKNANKSLSCQTDLNALHYNELGNWQRKVADDLAPTTYNEKNYFYSFVHSAIYDSGQDDTLVRHYERKEPARQSVRYVIGAKEKEYVLNVEKISFDLYAAGVGIMAFFLSNDTYSDKNDILFINQFGRRLFPPFANDILLRNETAKKISIDGLNGVYEENFEDYAEKSDRGVIKMNKCYNAIAPFIEKMIDEVVDEISTAPVIDDRMFVLSYFRNDALSNESKNVRFLNDDFWYKFVFVDSEDPTCQNRRMRHDLITHASYTRWQGWGTLYGASRYSLLMLTGEWEGINHLAETFVSIYARMVMLLLVQRASVLRFSKEVATLSRMHRGKELTDKVGSLYKEYIRFVNQIHFREVSAQEQGIELYQILYEQFQLKEQVEKLDSEIEEIYNYVSLCEDRNSNSIMNTLTWLAAILGTLSMVFAFWGMNNTWVTATSGIHVAWWFQSVIALVLTIVVWCIIKLFNKRK